MISKERFEELIEQNRIVYVLYGNKIYPHKAKDIAVNGINCVFIGFDFNHLFETKDEAEWVAKIHTEYTEHFNPPLFENLPYEYSFKFIRNGIEHELFCKRDAYIVVISCCKDYMSGTDDMEYNEENYTKAVEYARKLFIGEE